MVTKQGIFWLEMRQKKKKKINSGAAKHWNKLSRKAVESPSLEAFKTQLDKALGQFKHNEPNLSSRLDWINSWGQLLPKPGSGILYDRVPCQICPHNIPLAATSFIPTLQVATTQLSRYSLLVKKDFLFMLCTCICVFTYFTNYKKGCRKKS